MKKKLLSIMLVMLMFVTACSSGANDTSQTNATNSTQASSSEEGEEKIFTLTLFQNPKTLDIQKTNADYFIPIQIYDRLVETVVGENGEPEIAPSLAKSWEISEDGLVYTFHLRDDVKFHNGEKFKADDVLFTIEKMMDPKEATVNSSVFEPIKGAKEKLEGKADNVEGVKIIDDYTIEFTLEKPSGPFLSGLSGAPASIFNRKAVEEGKDKFGFDPEYTVGTGYMKFKDWTQDKEINLVRNDEYFGGPANIDGVKYLMNIDKATERMMFENGEIDFMGLDKSSYEKYKEDPERKDDIIEFVGPSMDYIIYNQNDPNMAKEEFRQAVSKAIDRETFNNTFYNGDAILVNGVVPPGMPGYQEDLPDLEYDLEEAKALIEKVGIDNSEPFIILQNGESDYTHPMNEMLQKMLKEIGIDAEIKNMDMTSYWDTVANGEGFAITIGPVTADIPDPDDFYAQFTIEGSKSNGYNVKDEEISNKINEARSIIDTDKRIEALNELDEEIVREKALFFPIAAEYSRFITSPRVENLNLSWQGWVAGATHDVEIVDE